MTLEFIDGFENAQGNYNLKWDPTSTQAAPTTGVGRWGGTCIEPTGAMYLTGTQLASVATRIIGFAFDYTSTSVSPLVIFMDGANTQCDVHVNATGNIEVRRASGTGLIAGSVILGTSTNTVTTNHWYYLEVSLTIGSTTGAFTIKVWGGPSPGTWLTASSQNTQNTANATQNGVILWGPSSICYYDDFYCLNTSGSVNNTFLGDVQVVTMMPSGDDASNKQWTPSAGTNHYANVSEIPEDSDTTYNSSATAGQIDLFTYPNSAPAGAIFATQSTMCARMDDTARTICEECRSGSTNYDGTHYNMTTSYSMYRQIHETDPHTSAAWTNANLAAAEFGVKVIA